MRSSTRLEQSSRIILRGMGRLMPSRREPHLLRDRLAAGVARRFYIQTRAAHWLKWPWWCQC